MGRAAAGRRPAFVAVGVASVLLVALVALAGRPGSEDRRPASGGGPSTVEAGSDAVRPHTPDEPGACPRSRHLLDDRSGTVLPPGAVGVTWCVGPEGASDPVGTMVTRGPREVLRSRRAIERLTRIVNRTMPGAFGCSDSSTIAEFGLAFTYPDGTARLVRTTRECPGRLQVGSRDTVHADRLLSVYAAEVTRARRRGSPPHADAAVRCARGDEVLAQFERIELVGVLGRVTRARLCPLAGSPTPQARDLTVAELDWLRTTPTRAASGDRLGPMRAVVVATTGWGDRIPIVIHARGAITFLGPTRRLPLRTWRLPATLRDLTPR